MKTRYHFKACNFALIIIIIFFLNGCADMETENREAVIIPIDKNDIHERVNYSEIFDYRETIILETSAECLIGKVDKIIMEDDLIFIFDRRISKALFVFNRNGDFLAKIQRFGKGPGEYTELHDFDISGGRILLFVGYPNKIIRLAYNGDYIDESKTSVSGVRFAGFYNDKYLIYTCGRAVHEKNRLLDYSVIEINKDGNITNTFLNNNDVNRGIRRCYAPSYFGFYRNDKSVLFSFPFSDTIFSYNGDNVRPKYILDYLNYKIPKEYNSFSIQEIQESPYGYGITRIFEDEESLFFITKYLTRGLYCLMNKKSGEFISTFFLYDDIYYAFPTIVSKFNDYFIGFAEASSIKYVAQNSSKYTQQKDLVIHRIANKIKEDDNPVIFLIKQKNHE